MSHVAVTVNMCCK